MNILYNLLIVLLSPIWVPWMLWRANKRKEKVDWKQRCGEYRLNLTKGSKRVWVHAVSVGEVVAALPILREVRELAPEAQIVLSVTTSSGHQTAREKALGLFDELVYFPIDVPRFVLAALVRVKPDVIAVMETELWMNFCQVAKNLGMPVLVVNGRISDRSYPRALKVRWFYRALLRTVSGCLMQTETDASRIRDLGAESAEVLGNCKFDEAVAGTDLGGKDWRVELGIGAEDRVVVVGSTRGEVEEEFVFGALKEVWGEVDQVVWAPRHMERADAIASRAGVEFGDVARRSKGETGKFLLLDTYGELSAVYSVADVVVVGGGFDNLGGQNIIQPLAHGKPVVHGLHMQNFRDVSEMAGRSGATLVVGTSGELALGLRELLGDGELRERMGSAARELVGAQVGASRRYAERIVGFLS